MKEITSLLADRDAVLVTVDRTEGSTPREAGTWMLVFEDEVAGTIGGGHVEFEAIARARRMLERGEGREGSARAAGGSSADPGAVHRFALGPSLGQCCGGVMDLRFRRVDAADLDELQSVLAANRAPVALFGGGHVGRAIVQALAPLPFALAWIDSRDGIFPADLPPHVQCEHSEPVQDAVRTLARGSRVLVMSFSHAEDLDIVAACLRRQREQGDLAFIGLIGSRTKWATFRHRLEQRGFTPGELAQVTCPIGVPGIIGKEPEVIAAAVAAQLLQIPRGSTR